MPAWLQKIAGLPPGFIAVFVIGAAIAFWFAYRGLQRARLIEDVPTAKIRSAPQGYVELIGEALALDGEPVVAPLTQTQCCWFRYSVEERGDKHWHTRESGSSDAIFAIRDETGVCVIDPEHAEVVTTHKQTWHGDGWGGGGSPYFRMQSLGRVADAAVKLGSWVGKGIMVGSGRYRFSESVILGGDPLYTIGRFSSLSATEPGQRKALMAAVIREWKQNPDTLRERFDLNRDGMIDEEEWNNARRVAKRQADEEFAELIKQQHVHTLGKPAKGRAFLISNVPPEQLVGRFRWQARIGFGVFVTLLSAALLITVRQLAM